MPKLGISKFGAYIPRYRLQRASISKAWGQDRIVKGERAVANYDEDSLTMAMNATFNCLDQPGEGDRGKPDALYFASTSAPYWEKQSSTTIAAVAELPRSIFTADLGGSLRAGTAAIKTALDAIASDNGKRALVVASDSRQVPPGSPLESWLGDGAACLEITSSEHDLAATVESTHFVSEEFMDTWRRGKDDYVNPGDTLFNRPHGYVRLVSECIKELLKKAHVLPEDVDRIALNAPDSRSAHAALHQAGLWTGEGDRDNRLYFFPLGDPGAAGPLAAFVQAMEESEPGDLLLLAGYGSGNCDAFLLRVTESVIPSKNGKGIAYHLARGRTLSNYMQFLRLKEHVGYEALIPYSSPSLLWKEQKQNLLLYGVRCRQCSAFAYPRRRVCLKCGSKDDYEDVKMGRTGRIYTFSVERIYPAPLPPTCMAVIDMDGGGRFYSQVTDCEPGDVAVGKKVELCFRKLHEGGGYHNYYWKCRLI